MPRHASIGAAGLALLLTGARWTAPPPVGPPKLVVVIVIDQFRADYLKRFQSYFGKGGFNLFLRRGADLTEARYLHGITQTCPGHAVILTGSYAHVNGIVANSWYDTAAGHEEYCAADSSVTLIGAGTEGRSPRNLIGSTVGDVLKLSTAGRSRVITVAGKDRSAIMLGGHLADAAYWMTDSLFVTSSYYKKRLPDWVRRFNASGLVSSYSGKTWDRLLPAAAYNRVGPDDGPGEGEVAGMGRTFPHRLGGGSNRNFFDAFGSSPFQNDLIAEFAMQAIVHDSLGSDDDPDLLAIGFSANDLIGHAYGPDSHEVMDVSVRTDRLLERFFAFLAKQVGLENTVIVLTADHGVAPLPETVARLNPALGGRFDTRSIVVAAESALEARYGPTREPGWIVSHDFPFLYLNVRSLGEKGVSIDEAERVAKAAVERVPGVQQALTAAELREQRNHAVHSAAAFSFFPARSGNIYYELQPYQVPGSQAQGTTHGSPWAYDTQVPLLWFGPEIVAGRYHDPSSVADIAPTLSAILDIGETAGSEGRVLSEILR